MNRPMLPWFLCLASLAVAAPPARSVPDRDLGLSKGSVFDVPTPPVFHEESSSPGEAPLPRRINRENPPVIPHGVGDFLPITRDSNLCLDCHAVPGPKKRGEATPVPASHYLDLRRDATKAGSKVAGARYVCISCHVPRTDAKPLVGSTFHP